PPDPPQRPAPPLHSFPTRRSSDLDASLRRLQTDYVDVYYVHFPDPSTPIEETMRALDDMVRSGRARYIACSNFSGWQLAQAQLIDRKSTRLNSSHVKISYAVFCLK